MGRGEEEDSRISVLMDDLPEIRSMGEEEGFVTNIIPVPVVSYISCMRQEYWVVLEVDLGEVKLQ